MTTETSKLSSLEPAAASAQPELLVSAVLHLMSYYTANNEEAGDRTRLASVIERHLKALADLPDLAPVLRATCRQLSAEWAGVGARAMPPVRKQRLFFGFAGRMRTA